MTTKTEIADACAELQTALIEELEANQREETAKAEKIKAHYHVLKAREALHNMNQN